MPRRPRTNTSQFVFHVLNRAVQNLVSFQQASDYEAFLRLLREAQKRIAMRILTYCIMPNHFHMVLWPEEDNSLSAFMQWMTATHVRRWRNWNGTTGRGALYQGRFKAFPVQKDDHFLRVCRYVERNPLRARLVARAEDWPWSTASHVANGCADQSSGDEWPKLSPWPVTKPPDWLELLHVPEPTRTLDEIRAAIRTAMPYGNAVWRSAAMSRLKWSRRRRVRRQALYLKACPWLDGAMPKRKKPRLTIL
jgi:putative transposase